MRESKQGWGGSQSRRSAPLEVCYDVAGRRRWQRNLELTNVCIDCTGRYILPTVIRTRTHLSFHIDKKCMCITAWLTK